MTRLTWLRWSCAALCALLPVSCGRGTFDAPPPPDELHVALAANLAKVFEALAGPAETALHVKLVPSFGSTAQLTRQIESGAPFDLFLAADTEHPAALAKEGLADAPREYARGRLALWAPRHPELRSLEDLRHPAIRSISVANPDLAPYGQAAVEALTRLGLWKELQPRVVFAQNISAALTFADTGNADAALTAYSLVVSRKPEAVLVPAELHSPISQSLCVLRRSSQMALTHKLADYLSGAEAAAIFTRNGYTVPRR